MKTKIAIDLKPGDVFGHNNETRWEVISQEITNTVLIPTTAKNVKTGTLKTFQFGKGVTLDIYETAKPQVKEKKELILEKSFSFINILTTVKMFRFGNATLSKSMEEVLRYCDYGDIIKIEMY